MTIDNPNLDQIPNPKPKKSQNRSSFLRGQGWHTNQYNYYPLQIYLIIKSLHDADNAVLMLEENDLPLKKIGKIIRKITVNFESKIPIEKIILFFGIEKVKEKLLLYLNDWWKTF